MKILLLKLKSKESAFLFSTLFTIFTFLFVFYHKWQYLIFALFSCHFWCFKLRWIVFVLINFIFIFLTIYFLQPVILTKQNLAGTFKIIDVNFYGFVIKNQNQKILVADYNNNYQIGDWVKITGEIGSLKANIASYFWTQQIVNELHFAQITLIKESQNWHTIFINYLARSPAIYQNYALLMLMGIKTKANAMIYNLATNLNIIHLFVISGFHISLLFFVCYKFLIICKLKTRAAQIMALVFCFFYLVLLRFPMAATRAFIILLLNFCNKHFWSNRFSKVTLLTLTLLLFALVNPYQITNIGFILTFLATYMLYFGLIIFPKNTKKRQLKISFLLYFSTFLIIATLNQKWIPLGFGWALFWSPFFTLMYLLTLCFFWFKPFLTFCYTGFDWLLKQTNHLNWSYHLPWLNFQLTQTFYLVTYISFIITIQCNYFLVKKNT